MKRKLNSDQLFQSPTKKSYDTETRTVQEHYLSGNKGKRSHSLNYTLLLVTLHAKGSDYKLVRNVKSVKVHDKDVLLN